MQERIREIDATLLAAACEFISEETAARHPKMQQELDAMYYMLFHLASFARGDGDGYALLASSDDTVNHFARTLYNFIKEHREEKQ